MKRYPLADLRRLWWRWARRYRYELCDMCGRPVSQSCPSWWSAPDELWARVEGCGCGIRCIPCFTADAREVGVHVYWAPVVDSEEASRAAA